MTDSFVDNYKSRHRHPLNQRSQSVGIPMIGVSVPLVFFSWRWALVFFVCGWLFQFIGHVVEGNQPAFFSNPIYLLIGPWWLVRRAAEVVGIRKQSATK